jgi:predicted transcriptional regulator of viral defense system
LLSSSTDQAIEDPWALIPDLFGPAYVGGASAAHHWDLTEQLFRTVFVYTARPVQRRNHAIQGTEFVVRHVAAENLFGTRSLWHGRTRIQVSDVHRTIVDMLNTPADGGGIRHVADCLRTYVGRDNADPGRLIAYADRLGNGAVFKRLGFLAEHGGGPARLVEACAARLTKGVVKLDPIVASPRLLRRRRLWLPERWRAEARSHG